ncbi:MAG TPA: DUF4440 domain-containing protein, partial [Candidatus Acidoferrales bacterium]
MLRSCGPLLLAATFVFSLCIAGCSRQPAAPATPPDTRAADEAAIRAADADWGKAATAKDLDKVMSYYMDDAVLFAPKAPASVGKDSIRKGWQGLLSAPGLQMTITPSTVDVARSGDLAMERGSFSVVTMDKKGKPATDTGQFVIV